MSGKLTLYMSEEGRENFEEGRNFIASWRKEEKRHIEFTVSRVHVMLMDANHLIIEGESDAEIRKDVAK